MFKTNIFFVIGSDFLSRKRAIDNIKSKFLQNNSLLNTHTYYSNEIDLYELRSSIFNLSLGGKKIIVFREAQHLSKEIKDFLLTNIKIIVKDSYLIFDIERDFSSFKQDKYFIRDGFFNYFFKRATVLKLSSFIKDVSIKKLIQMIKKNSLSEALYVLEGIFSSADKSRDIVGMQILGAITKSFSYINNPHKKKRCFDLIYRTERLLKERQIESKIALGLLITRLIMLY